MALSAKNRNEIVCLIGRETDFERSGISGRKVFTPTDTPRQGEMEQGQYDFLLRQIGRGYVRYVVFSYQTVIAWVYKNGSVALPDVFHSSTTSQHQKMVRDAFPDELINNRLMTEPHGDEPVALSENEEIVLRRMRDADGTEYEVVFKGPAQAGDQQRFAPRDQVEPLVLKGLAVYLTGVAGHGEYGVVLTPKGRKYLDKIQPVTDKLGEHLAEVTAAMYADLTEDEMIELLTQTREKWTSNNVTAVEAMAAMAAISEALQNRRKATEAARIRVGGYLRHAAIQQEKYDRDMASSSDYSRRNAKPPTENIDELRAEEWTKAGELRLSDLQQLVPTRVFDGKQLFMDTQADRLEQWKAHPDYAALSEKQKALLPCIAAQHISNGYQGWTHDSDATNRHECYTRIHQSTMNSLLKKKHMVGTRTRPGMAVHKTSYLILKAVPQD